MPFVTRKGCLKIGLGPEGKPFELTCGYLFNFDPANPMTAKVLYRGTYSPARKEWDSDIVLWRVYIEGWTERTWDWFLTILPKVPDIVYEESGEDIYLTNPKLSKAWCLPDKILQYLLDNNKIQNEDLREMAKQRIALGTASQADADAVVVAAQANKQITDDLKAENEALRSQLLAKVDPKKSVRGRGKRKVKS